MSNRAYLIAALAAASLVNVEPARADVYQGHKPKGKMEVPPRPAPKPQSQSLKRMLRKAR